MSNPESALWAYVRAGMRGRWHATRHEDCATAGVPDVSYGLRGRCGWIELKKLTRVAKKPDAFFKIHSLTREQVAFLQWRGRVGGCGCWLLVQIGEAVARREFFLFHWSVIKKLRDGVDKRQLPGIAKARWIGRIPWDDFAKLI